MNSEISHEKLFERIADLSGRLADCSDVSIALGELLECAVDIGGAVRAVLVASPYEMTAVIGESALDGEASDLTKTARLEWDTPLAEEVTEIETDVVIDPARRRAVWASDTGGVVLLEPDFDRLQSAVVRHALTSLANFCTWAIAQAEEAAAATRRAEEQERMHQQLVQSNMSLRERSMVDELTGLYNRRFFERSLAYEVERFKRYQHPIGLLMVDIDHFKKINDTYGHDIGDLALKHLAAVAKQTIRTADLFARLGGEEFVALLPDTWLEGSEITAERLRVAVEESALETPKGELKFTISVGVTSVEHELPGDEHWLLKVVDNALYEAKETGRNRWVSVSLETLET